MVTTLGLRLQTKMFSYSISRVCFEDKRRHLLECFAVTASNLKVRRRNESRPFSSVCCIQNHYSSKWTQSMHPGIVATAKHLQGRRTLLATAGTKLDVDKARDAKNSSEDKPNVRPKDSSSDESVVAITKTKTSNGKAKGTGEIYHHGSNNGSYNGNSNGSSSNNGGLVIHDDTNTPSFRIAKLYYNGKVETANLHLSELVRSASIYARDLFALNLTSRQERRGRSSLRAARSIPSILSPRNSILILSFGTIRAVAGLDCIFLFDAHKNNVQEFTKELSELFKHPSNADRPEPSELVFLEKALQDTVESYQRRLRIFEPIVDSFLDKVNNEVYSDTGVHQLVPLKDSLQSFEMQVKQSLDCLTALLNNDDEMLALLLTEQAAAAKSGQRVDFSRHEHVELLIGVYARQLNNILMEVHFFQSRLQSKQEFVALALSGYRNRMVRMNVHIGIAALSLGVCTSVAGFFGMNLANGLEHSQTAFMTVISMSVFTAAMVATGSLNYLSGKTMRERAKQRSGEIETLTSALADMTALDFTIKHMVNKGISLDKHHFRQTLKRARESKKVTDEEVDLLFDILDRVKDGQINSEDFDYTEETKNLK